MAKMTPEATRPLPRERIKQILSELVDVIADRLEDLRKSSAIPSPDPSPATPSAALPDVEKVSNFPRMLRLSEVRERTGLSRTSIYKYIQTDIFPRPRKIGSRMTRWLSTDIDSWMQGSYNQQPERKGRGGTHT